MAKACPPSAGMHLKIRSFCCRIRRRSPTRDPVGRGPGLPSHPGRVVPYRQLYDRSTPTSWRPRAAPAAPPRHRDPRARLPRPARPARARGGPRRQQRPAGVHHRRRRRRAGGRGRQLAHRLRLRHRRGLGRQQRAPGGRAGPASRRPGSPTPASWSRRTRGTWPCARSWPGARRAATRSGRRCSTPARRRWRTRSRSPGTHTGRQAVVAFDHAYHGRTNLTMALTAKNMPYKDKFGPFAGEIYRMPMAYPLRWPGGPEPVRQGGPGRDHQR